MKPLDNELVLASAGSGKTYRLSNRVVGLILRGVEPRKIAALTFTKKAAGEFADAILTKLADAAGSEEVAQRLAVELEADGATRKDFVDALERVVDQLPELFLGTLDSFFAKVVRCFQYELGVGGGQFELVQGEAATQALESVISKILLGDELSPQERDEFLNAFKLATLGKEENRISKLLQDFVEGWHRRYLADPQPMPWGDAAVALPGLVASEAAMDSRKGELLSELEMVGPDHVKFRGMCVFLRDFDGIGEFGKTGLLAKVLEQWQDFESGDVDVIFNKKPITFNDRARVLTKQLIELLAAQEAMRKLSQTVALYQVMHAYEQRYDVMQRRSGKLTFDDLKLKMSEWSRSEVARVRREMVDFRLDSRYDQWLLDEFQDTSREQWMGVQNLIDEVVNDGDPNRGLFVVGDKKQGIYAWRGGDHELFGEVQEHFGDRLKPYTMAESNRSYQPVLDLVNTVFSAKAVMAGLFPAKAVDGWQWEEHRTAARLGDKPSYATVYEVPKDDDEDAHMAAALETIKEIDPVARGLSCALLFRGNKAVKDYAERLRAEGYLVAEEGMCKPGQDNVVGRAVVAMLRWMQNPADAYEARHLEMAGWLGENEFAQWKQWHGQADELGWSGFVKELEMPELSDFGAQRLEQVLQAIEAAVAAGVTNPGELADMVHNYEAPMDEQKGAIQVMTIHKSKGLGFDVVIMPNVSDSKEIKVKDYDVCRKTDESGEVELISQTPRTWARQVLPVYKEAEDEWMATQAYENFCVLYVAMTRAKRALYIQLPEPKKDEKESFAEWLRQACGGTEPVYSGGDAQWYESCERVPEQVTEEVEIALPTLAKEKERAKASKALTGALTAERLAAIALGTEVHALCEGIGWIGGDVPDLPETAAGDRLRFALKSKEVRDVFTRPGGDVELLREQAFEVILDGKWISGVIDRVHLLREGGDVKRAEIYDFKVESGEMEEHGDQLDIYRRAIVDIYGISTADVVATVVRL